MSYFSINKTFASKTYIYKNNQKHKDIFIKNTDKTYAPFIISEKDGIIFEKTHNYTKKENWKKALSWAGTIHNDNFRDPTIDYVLWKKYSDLKVSKGTEEFTNLIGFIEKNQFLPNKKNLKIKAENIFLQNDIPYIHAEKYFKKFPPTNIEVTLKILQTKILDNLSSLEEIEKDIKNIWINKNFTKKQEEKFLELYFDYLDETDHAQRIDRLIWEYKLKEAERILKFAEINYKILFKARIELTRKPKLHYINHLLRSIPRQLRRNEGLLYERIKRLHKDDKKDIIVKILLIIPSDSKYGSAWWHYRKLYSRELVKNKKFKKAYYIVKNHNLKPGGIPYAEAEWLAGWIALRFLNKPEQAYKHFYKLYTNVKYPVSTARATYWLGRAKEKAKDNIQALKWYEEASKYTTFFYGQIASHNKYQLLKKETPEKSNILPQIPVITKEDKIKIKNNRIVKMAYLTSLYTGNIKDATYMFQHAISTAKTKSEIAEIVNIVKSLNNERMTTDIIKHASYNNVFFVKDLYPILSIINKNNPNAHLIHAIIKQESGFYIQAKSSAGAIGFMQIMPDTGKYLAKKMKIRYSKRKLQHNPKYNIAMGTYYITMLVDKFKGSEMLAIASYNAGPSATRKWIKTFGDPRDFKEIDDIVDWMELITYPETRNYVQRVLENSIVYEYLLEKHKKEKL